MILIYPSIEDYYLEVITLSRTFTFSYQSYDSSLFFFISLDDLFGRPFPRGRPGRPAPLPGLIEEKDSLYEGYTYKSSSSRDGSF